MHASVFSPLMFMEHDPHIPEAGGKQIDSIIHSYGLVTAENTMQGVGKGFG